MGVINFGSSEMYQSGWRWHVIYKFTKHIPSHPIYHTSIHQTTQQTTHQPKRSSVRPSLYTCPHFSSHLLKLETEWDGMDWFGWE